MLGGKRSLRAPVWLAVTSAIQDLSRAGAGTTLSGLREQARRILEQRQYA